MVKLLVFSMYRFVSALCQFSILITNLNVLFYFFNFLSNCHEENFNTMVNKSGKNKRHPCLVFDLREKAFNFIPFNMMLVENLAYLVFVILRLLWYSFCFFFIHLIECFYCKWRLNFVRYFFFLHLLRWSYDFILHWYIMWTDLQILNNPFISVINSIWLWVFLLYC